MYLFCVRYILHDIKRIKKGALLLSGAIASREIYVKTFSVYPPTGISKRMRLCPPKFFLQKWKVLGRTPSGWSNNEPVFTCGLQMKWFLFLSSGRAISYVSPQTSRNQNSHLKKTFSKIKQNKNSEIRFNLFTFT